MAESLDTSEVLPDEDDRKLFVGGLPQVSEWSTVALSAWFGCLLPSDTCCIKFLRSVTQK